MMMEIVFLGERFLQQTVIMYFSLCPTAGDLKGAVETLRSLLLFYPTDSDSLSNLQLYTQNLEGDTDAQETGPLQVGYKHDDWI